MQKISMVYSQIDDRVLLIVFTAQGKHRFWMTRRFVRIIWKPLVVNLENFPDIRKHLDGQIRKAVLSMRHQDALEKSAFSTESFKEELLKTAAPPADAPGPARQTPSPPRENSPAAEVAHDDATINLIIGVSGGMHKDGRLGLVFNLQNGKSFHLFLDEKLFHAFCHLLVEVTSKAGWNLDLRVVDKDGMAVESGAVAH
ncbi:MAG: hypothetical protein A3G18_01810 [Rhodospirillales bacterium RIFCSPLOWO2_12_FULL_58_28]|nr:MAG: hypothetical protein A3H92_07705 [Rhodospirillales bacterium RIFCSPLOWO2_02_FULL_58_16]OHC79032.1 MAG: hypothetical protein A3G18_01810 [Rhodospirillales bacterium RIFCSPLOWO2_12_FULL_58_28]